MKRKVFCLILALALALSLAAPAAAQLSDRALLDAVSDAAQYVVKTVPKPQVGATGGEWAVLGLARSGCRVPDGYFRDYYAAVEAYVRACKGQLHDKKYTEYARVIVALAALGKDARRVAGYDLTRPLGDYEKTIRQGINGPIWALIALDSLDYPMPQDPEAKTQATRQLYIDRILDSQLPDGGWSLRAQGTSDPDVTGMALQALAKYQDQPAVKKATDEALACMSRAQDAGGGFAAWGAANCESVVQMICALCELGIPLDDARFVKGGKTMLDNLMTFYQKGGGFRHTDAGDGASQMTSEQGLYALVAIQRVRLGQSSLYRMAETPVASDGLPGRHADVHPAAIQASGKTFPDVAGHGAQDAVEALAARGILSGMSDGRFHPDATMTRAEFATAVVRALGLTPKATGDFTDVAAGEWYAPYVGTAAAYGVITGVGGGKFNPSGTITRQEAASMVARAAKLCGLDTALDDGAVRSALARFTDAAKTPTWARQSLAFCYQAGILDAGAPAIQGTAAVRRGEIAQMLHRLLRSAALL